MFSIAFDAPASEPQRLGRRELAFSRSSVPIDGPWWQSKCNAEFTLREVLPQLLHTGFSFPRSRRIPLRLISEVNCNEHLSLCAENDMSFPPRQGQMLDKTEQAIARTDRRQASYYLVPILFFGLAGLAMIAWISAIGWMSWCFTLWLLF